MHSIETLDVIGYRNEVVPCTFFHQEPSTSHIAVLFPWIRIHRLYVTHVLSKTVASRIRRCPRMAHKDFKALRGMMETEVFDEEIFGFQA